MRAAPSTLALLLVLGPGGAAGAVEDPAQLSLAVAPFERVAPPGAQVPDAARLLADRLGTRGVGRVVGPDEFGAEALAEPSAEQVKAWASEAEVAVLVVGRATRIGRRISLDLRLRSAGSGAVLSTHVAEAARPEDLEMAVDRLADQVVQGAQAADAAPPVSAAGGSGGGAASAGEEDEDEGGRGFLGIGGGRKDQPISIRSDELEAFQAGGERRFVFKRRVRVRQGDMYLTCRHLEAFYPDGQSQPERLVATGRVVLSQEDKRARCDQATYLRSEQKVVCVGDPAELTQGEDRVRGKQIDFFLDTDRLIVRGGADVRLQSSGGEDDGGGV